MRIHLWPFAFLLLAVSTTAQAPANAFYPKPTHSDFPTYPERALMAHVAGPVKLWFIVDQSGKVSQAGILSGNSMLRDAALSALRSWEFRPGSIQPNIKHESEFTYDLKTRSEAGEPKLTVSITDFRRVEIISEIYVRTVE